ncbi:CRTAC1 family protein [Planctomycetes bacterium K23_9]|uniref:FG-GAP repeat protein n=1 Tax=Stieleria marina TaxID=1930275 RepID=A0A517P0V7_9BACT|nr:FG-GAP repeat protein [Planctomycetes bacterium K23_9]
MTQPDQPTDETHDDVENDAVIGHAFRASLIALVFLMLPVIGILLFLNLRKPKQEAVEAIVENPEQRVDEDGKIPSLRMVDVTAESGIDFQHETGRYGDKLLPETMGSGVAVLDYNNDGHQDLLLVNSRRWPWDEQQVESKSKLFAGNGQFGFSDVSAEAGIDFETYGMGVAVGDYDNDGDADVFISAVGANRLLQNDDGKYTDVTNQAGVSGAENAWSTSCGFFDYDNDGLLDLFVCNYVSWSEEADLSQNFTLDGESRAYGPPKAFAGSYSYLYHNDGEGKFTDVSASAGIQIRNDDTDVPLGKAMGLAPVDVNRDGWIDIIVSNDTVRNFLFENNQDGTFSEKGRLLGIAYDRSGNARGAMGIDTTVFRSNGTLAIGIGNFANEQSALYMASPKRAQFVDGAIATGFGPPTRSGLTFGMFFFDVDLDGRPDVLGANGHLEEEIAKTQRTQQYAQSPQLFWNAGRQANSELVEVPESCSGTAFCDPIVGRGAAFGDFDEDGDQDVVISVSGGSPKVFRNDQQTGHHYLRVRLQGSPANRDGLGARVSIKSGDRIWEQQLMPTRSYLSQSERVLTFGLGTVDTVDEVTVTWPGGLATVHEVDSVDQTIEIKQGAAEKSSS